MNFIQPLSKHWRGVVSLLCLLTLWQLIVSLCQIAPYILPSPFRVFATIMHNHHLLLMETLPTAVESITGLLLASVIGIFAAIVLIYFPILRLWLLPSLIISQALPTFAIAPLLVLWLGYGLASKIITVMIMLFFPITTAFYDGLSRIQTGWFDLAQTMQASRSTALRYLLIPAALPALASGLRLAAAGAPLAAIMGEWVGASQGLGFLILNANARLQIDLLFAALVFLVMLALALFFTIDKGITCLLSKYY